MNKAIVILLCWLAFAPRIKAQQDPMYSMYMFNGLVLNPAYAGSQDRFSAVAIGRQQWVGLDGAPRTQSLGLHGTSVNQRNGYGLSIVNDKVGFTSNLNANLSYALRLPVGENARFSLGIQAGANQFRVRKSEVDTWQSGDDAFNGEDFNKVHFMAGAGLYFQSKNLFLGASIPNVIPNRLYDPIEFELLEARKYHHYFFTAGLILNIGNALKLKPSTLIKYNRGSGIAIDLNANLYYKERIGLGALVRPGQAWVFICELFVTRQLRVGYAYDYNVSNRSAYVGGTHELMIGIDLNFLKQKMDSPRLF